VEAEPLPGWLILNARHASVAPPSQAQSASTAGGATDDSVAAHAGVASIAATPDPAVEFVSPVFRDAAGNAVVLTSRLLIGFQKDCSATERASLLASVPEGAVVEPMKFSQPNRERWQIHTRDGFAALARANEIAQTPGVEYTEPDMIVTSRSTLIPNDPSFTQSWGLRNTGQLGGLVGFDMQGTAAWDITKGSPSVIVVVLDDGIQQNHPDIHQIPGKDFTSDAAANPSGGPVGRYDIHATLVAGCITEQINNSIGTAGIAPGCNVASARVVTNSQQDGSATLLFSWFVDALNWGQSIGARVSNCSNTFGPPSSAVEDAYASTRNNGMVHFAAAGNGASGSIGYPASIPSVNAVASANRFGQRSSFSQYGTGLKFIAPGEQILTTDRTGNAESSAGATRSQAVPPSLRRMLPVSPLWSFRKIRRSLPLTWKHECRPPAPVWGHSDTTSTLVMVW
jgi:hypothetical protein